MQKNGETYQQLFENIHVVNNVLIGTNALILPGITIEDNCVFGTGSVVCKDVKSGTVVARNSIKKLEHLKILKINESTISGAKFENYENITCFYRKSNPT